MSESTRTGYDTIRASPRSLTLRTSYSAEMLWSRSAFRTSLSRRIPPDQPVLSGCRMLKVSATAPAAPVRIISGASMRSNFGFQHSCVEVQRGVPKRASVSRTDGAVVARGGAGAGGTTAAGGAVGGGGTGGATGGGGGGAGGGGCPGTDAGAPSSARAAAGAAQRDASTALAQPMLRHDRCLFCDLVA